MSNSNSSNGVGQLYRTTFEYQRDGDEWTAWEGAADNEIVGRAATRAMAVSDYCIKLEQRGNDEQE